MCGPLRQASAPNAALRRATRPMKSYFMLTYSIAGLAGPSDYHTAATGVAGPLRERLCHPSGASAGLTSFTLAPASASPTRTCRSASCNWAYACPWAPRCGGRCRDVDTRVVGPVALDAAVDLRPVPPLLPFDKSVWLAALLSSSRSHTEHDSPGGHGHPRSLGSGLCRDRPDATASPLYTTSPPIITKYATKYLRRG